MPWLRSAAAAVEDDPALAREQELARLRSAPAGVPTTTTLIYPSFDLLDGPSFVPQYEEIFLREIYDFPFAGAEPTIIDGGANVGTAIAWWRARWPAARIIAFEADPAVFAVLQRNTQNHPDLDLRNTALSTPALGSTFLLQGTDAGRLGDPAAKASQGVGLPASVPTERLRDVIDALAAVDLLKLDIEGAETAVLLDAEDVLSRVERIFVEYHSLAGATQELADLTALLRRQQFRIFLTAPSWAMRPFQGVHVDRGIDLQCNIFAFRPSS